MSTACLSLLAFLLSAPPQSVVPEPSPIARTHTVVGELSRLDLDRRELTVRESAARRDHVIPYGADTRFVGGGRELRLADLHAGDAIVVVCRDEGSAHRAVLVKVGASRYAVPTPGARRP